MFCSKFVILFTLLSDNTSYHCLNLRLLFVNKGLSTEFATITQDISSNNIKVKV